MKIISQRDKYLQERKAKTLVFWHKVVADYNPPNPISAKEIALKYINPNTGKNYSRQQIYVILKKMRAL